MKNLIVAIVLIALTIGALSLLGSIDNVISDGAWKLWELGKSL